MPIDESRNVGFTIKALNNQIKRVLAQNAGSEPDEEKRYTGMQYGLLDFIVRNTKAENDVYQKDIEVEFNIRRSTASGILQLMEKNGLIRREAVQHDARLKRLEPTEKAWALAQEISNNIEKINTALTAGISEEDLAHFYKVIDKMMENLAG